MTLPKKRPQPLETLSEEIREMFDVLNEESDLAAALIGTSYLDDCLASTLFRYFVDASVRPSTKTATTPARARSTTPSGAPRIRCQAFHKSPIFSSLRLLKALETTPRRAEVAHRELDRVRSGSNASVPETKRPLVPSMGGFRWRLHALRPDPARLGDGS